MISAYGYEKVWAECAQAEERSTKSGKPSKVGFVFQMLRTEHVPALAEALDKHRIARVELVGNQLGKDGLANLAAALATNVSLTSLELTRSSAGPEGAQALAKALETNSSLQTLDLSYNDLGDEGCKSIAAVLPQTTITSLTCVAASTA